MVNIRLSERKWFQRERERKAKKEVKTEWNEMKKKTTRTSKIIDTRNAINIVDFEMDRVNEKERRKKNRTAQNENKQSNQVTKK